MVGVLVGYENKLRADAVGSRIVEREATRGEESPDLKAAGLCRELTKWWPALWTFARVESVEPTNNGAERALRPAVLWRKRSFGCASAAGCRFVERILTVVQTRRLRGEPVLDYLHDALRAHRAGEPCPKLLPEG